jgi:DnaK suppressor protein
VSVTTHGRQGGRDEEGTTGELQEASAGKHEQLADGVGRSASYGKDQEDDAIKDLGDQANTAYTREFFFELGNGDRRLLRDVVAALQKIDDGSFGNCERCGETIGDKRLEALPFARSLHRLPASGRGRRNAAPADAFPAAFQPLPVLPPHECLARARCSVGRQVGAVRARPAGPAATTIRRRRRHAPRARGAGAGGWTRRARSIATSCSAGRTTPTRSHAARSRHRRRATGTRPSPSSSDSLDGRAAHRPRGGVDGWRWATTSSAVSSWPAARGGAPSALQGRLAADRDFLPAACSRWRRLRVVRRPPRGRAHLGAGGRDRPALPLLARLERAIREDARPPG